MKRVLKWTIPVDDKPHPIGRGRVVHVACLYGPGQVEVWTEEYGSGVERRMAQVYGTGHTFSDGGEVAGSVITDVGIVWHVVTFR